MLKNLIYEKFTMAVDASGGADTQYSDAWSMDDISVVSLQVVINETGVGSGTLSFQRTNIPADPNDPGSGPSTTAADWQDIEAETAISADTTEWYTKIGPEYKWLRVKSGAASGEMAITGWIVAKGEDKK